MNGEVNVYVQPAQILIEQCALIEGLRTKPIRMGYAPKMAKARDLLLAL